jgi:hypothetical protein
VNDLIKLVLAQIPKYISNLLTLISQPKRFIRKKRDHSDESLTEAFTFLGITFVLDLILKSSFIPEETNFWQYIGTRGVYDLMEIILLSTVVRFSWRLVGSNSPFVRFLIPTCYLYATFAIAAAIHQLFAYGIAKVWDVELYNLLLGTFKDKRSSMRSWKHTYQPPWSRQNRAIRGDSPCLLSTIWFYC